MGPPEYCLNDFTVWRVKFAQYYEVKVVEHGTSFNDFFGTVDSIGRLLNVADMRDSIKWV